MKTVFGSPGNLYSLVSVGEAITWGFLISGLIIRATGNAPEWLIPLVGGIHGFMFLSYAVIAALVGVNQRWGFVGVAIAVVLAIVPFATVPYDRYLKKRQRLTGDWRLEATDNQKDNGLIDRLFRWFINRPLVLVSVLVVGVVVVYVFLLWLGPPDEWGQ